MDKISVIIPIYNREKYIRKCLESIINQTYQNVEIICVDDKSTDSSLSICKEYAQIDNRIKVVALEKNLGVSNARNTGIINATGEWIAFVDSDDYMDLSMYEKLITLGKKLDADVVLSDLNITANNNNHDMLIELSPYKNYSKEEILPLVTQYGEGNLSIYSLLAKIIRSSVIKDNNIVFDKDISYQEDRMFVIEVFANSRNICYYPEGLYKYEALPGGLYAKFNTESWHWYVNLYNKYLYLIRHYRITNADISYVNHDFVYNITWFLYRSQRIENKSERQQLQNLVIQDMEVQRICAEIVELLSSFDRRMAKAILSKKRWKAIKMIDFVYSGKKDKLLKILKR